MLTPKQNQFRIANIAPAQGDWNSVRLPKVLNGVRMQMHASLGEKIHYLNDEEYCLVLSDAVEKHYQDQCTAIIEGAKLNKADKKKYKAYLKQDRLLLARKRGGQVFNTLIKPEDIAQIEAPLEYEFFSPSLQVSELYLESLLDDQAAVHIIKKLKSAHFAAVPGSLQIKNGKVSLKAFSDKFGQNEVEVDLKEAGISPFDLKFIDATGKEKHVTETQLSSEYGNITDAAPQPITSVQTAALAFMPSGKSKVAEQAAQAQMAMSAAALAAEQAQNIQMLQAIQATQSAMEGNNKLNNTQNVMASKTALKQHALRDQMKNEKAKKRAFELAEEAKIYRGQAKLNAANTVASKKKSSGARFVTGMAAGGGVLAAGGSGLIGYLTLFT